MGGESARTREAPSGDEAAVRELYRHFIDGWNARDAAALAEPFAEDGEVIGFDGSQVAGQFAILANMVGLFADHLTPPYLTIVRGVRFLGPDAAMLRAVAGMVPPGATDIEPRLNAIQTLVAARRNGTWRIALVQTTPAQYHGHPELVESLTAELRALL